MKKVIYGAKTILFISLLVCFVSSAYAATISIPTREGSGTVTMDINVVYDGLEPTLVAGAAFTLQYDTTKLEVIEVTSDFFETFAVQQSKAPNWSGGTSVVVGQYTYDQPIIKNDTTIPVIPKGTRVAGARFDAADAGHTTTLFKVKFQLLAGASIGEYFVEAIPTSLCNPTAGYGDDPDGSLPDSYSGDEEFGRVNALVGADSSIQDPTNAFPVLLGNGSSPSTVYAQGTARFLEGTPPITITHDYETGLNLVPFTPMNTGVTMASDWDAEIVAANPGVSVSQIFGWDPVNQKFTGSYSNLGGGFVIGDFEPTEGASYFIELSGDATLTLAGNDYPTIHLYPGLNLMAVPAGLAGTLTMASDLDAEIVSKTGLTVSQIFSWDPITQKFTGSYSNLGGGFVIGDFQLDANSKGYFVEVDGEAIYEPYN